MIKRTLYFSNPAYLSLTLGQLVIRMPDNKKPAGNKEGSKGSDKDAVVKTVPIEDIGVVILDHRQITITQGLMEELMENNCAVITCDSSHMPTGLLLPLYGHTLQNERYRFQLDASLPLKKQLWQQTVKCKIHNQAAVLKYISGNEQGNMLAWENAVKSGDSDNLEARAAAYYWKNFLPGNSSFIRDRFEAEPNNLLNYGYAILRAVIARAIVGSGLLPTLGIHHHNRYNAYCLADDIMEPYRPYVDKLVADMCRDEEDLTLTTALKVKLLSIPVLEVEIGGRRSPLMVAASATTTSLFKCFSGEIRKIAYPEMS